MSDRKTIYLDDAIDEIKEIYEWHDSVTKERIIEHFKRLPSAEVRTQMSSADCISRQDAIDALGEEPEVWWDTIETLDEYAVGARNQWRMDVAAIEALPSAERKGKWIFNPSDAIEAMFAKPKCSECGFESADGGNYCSNCGASMVRGENDE